MNYSEVDAQYVSNVIRQFYTQSNSPQEHQAVSLITIFEPCITEFCNAFG